MEKGASLHLKDALGQNALHHCAKNFDTSFVIKFINLGLSVHEANLNGQKLSHLAAEYNNTELLKLLVSMEGGAALNIDSKDRDGYTPLHSAAFQGSDDALLLLLPHGNINEPSDSGVSVLHLALHSCNQRTIEVLIENGADIFAESDFGYNVMHYLVQNPNETTAILDMFHKRGISFHGGKDNGDTPLHIAFGIKDDLTPSRHSLIKQIIPYCNLNAVNAKGETPLHSLFWSNIHVAKKTSLSITLINAGADPKIKDKVGDSYAQLLLLKLRESDSGSIAEKNSLDLIESILRSPNVVSAFSEKIDGIRPLNLLLQRSGNLADFLVSQGIDFTLRNESGIPVSGVEMACYCDDLITLDMMLAKSKSFSRTFPPAHLLLIMASKSKKNTTVLVQRILSLGCDVNAPGHDFELALISAVQQSNTEIAKLLLEHGASPEKRGGEVVQLNWNAIHWAIYHSNLELLSAFLKLNVNWDIRTNFFNAHRNKISLDLNNAHCLHLASLYEHSNSTSFLLKHGLADVNVRDSVGTTALHCSAWTGQLECTELLLAAGADPEAKDNYGNTPLHFITFGTGNIELALRLLDAGCRQLPDVDGKTPEMWALQKGQLELAKALRERRTQNGMLSYASHPTNSLNVRQEMNDVCEIF
jgi:ankyrin repeat protein